MAKPEMSKSTLPDSVILTQGGHAKVCRILDWPTPTFQATENWEALEAEAAAFTRVTRWSPWRVSGATFYGHCPASLIARATFRAF
jgi:hypothetical protein